MKNTVRIVLSLAALIAFGACTKKEEAKVSRPPSPVVLGSAQTKNAPRYLECLGTIHSFNSVSVMPQVTGQIVEITFKQGDIVKEGDIIAKIDPRPFQAAVMQAQGNLNQALAQLKIDELEVTRNKTLVKDKYIDQQTFDTYVAKVEMDKGVIETCRGALEQAKINLEWCTIKSPVGGKIGFYEIDLGNIVNANVSKITSIEQIDKLYVDFVIPNQFLNEVKTFMDKNGGKLDLVVKYIEDDMRHLSQDATVSIIQNQVRYQSGTVVLRGELENSKGIFWPNQPIKANLVLESLKDAVVIPYQSIETGPVGKYVYAAKVAEWPVRLIEKKTVEIIQVNDDGTAIVKGVNGGDDLVINGQLGVSMGSFALAYSSTLMGLPYEQDGKTTINPAKLHEFIGNATQIAEKLRAQEHAKAAAKAAPQAEAKKDENKKSAAQLK